MSFQTEIEKLARTRRAYLRFALAENTPGRLWTGAVDRRYGKVGDAQATVPVLGTVARFGTIQRSLANYLYSLEVPHVSVELFDPDREWRALAGGFEDQIVYRNLSLWLRVLDDVLAPYDERVAVAQIVKPSFPQGRVTLDCEVAAGGFLGTKIPRRFITTADFPNCPPETQGLPVPIIYGRRHNDVASVAPPPIVVTGMPGGSESDDPVSLPPITSGIVYCDDLWTDDFEAETIDSGYTGQDDFTLEPGEGVDESQAIRSAAIGAELSRVVSPPRRSFCIEWTSDTDQQIQGYVQEPVEGVNVFRMSDRDISIQVPLAGQLTFLRNAITPGTRQTFKLEGAFATKNLDVTLTAPLTPSQTVLYVSSSDRTRLRVGMHLLINGEIVRILSFPTTEGGVNIIRSQFETYPGGGSRFVDGEWVYYPAIAETGTVLETYDVNGYLKFYINGTVRYSRMNTDLIRSGDDEGAWSTVAWTPWGDGDDLSIGSGIVFSTTSTGGGGGTSLTPGTPIDCDPGGTSPSASGAAVRAILVGTYMRGDTGDLVPIANPCGVSPYGSVAALAAALQAQKDAGTLMTSHFPRCLGYADCQRIVSLTGPVPTTEAELAALIGWSDMRCMAFGECAGTAGGTGSQDNLYVLAGHALKAVTAVYVLKPVVVAIENDNPVYSEPLQIQMVEGTDYRQEWRDINGHRYHFLVFTAAQVSETCEYFEVTANVEGIETNADSSGTLIENADEVFEHIMLNWILNNYQSSAGPFAPPGSPWFTDVPYAPGIWDHDSVEAAKLVAEARLPGGYIACGTLDEVIEAREWIRELLISFDLELYFDNAAGIQGAWCITRFDPTIPRASLPHWDAGVDAILKDSFSTELVVDQMLNIIPFFGGPTTQRTNEGAIKNTDAGGGGWRISGEMRSSSSIDRFGMAISSPVYLKWTDHAPTIANVMAQYLAYQELPPVPATFRMGLRALTSPLGSLVRLTHPDAIGPTGWTEHVCKVIRSDLDLDRLVAQVTVVSMDRLMGT